MTSEAAQPARNGTVRSRRSRTLMAAPAVVALCALGVHFSSAASAVSSAISVSPSSGLQNGQSVTVHGTGFSANVNNINIVQCPVSGASQSSCDIIDGKLFQSTDSSGAFTVQLTVKAKLAAIDCTVVACLIDAHEGTSATSGNDASQNITFEVAPPTSPAPTTSSGSTSATGASSGGGNGSATPAAGGGPTGANTGRADVAKAPISTVLWLSAVGVALIALSAALHMRRTRRTNSPSGAAD